VRSPELLLLDEPTSALDLQHQMEVLDLVSEMTVRRGMTTLVAMHDLNLAARFAEHLIVLKEGRLFAAGPTALVLTDAMIAAVYGVNARVYAVDGTIAVLPLSSARGRSGNDPIPLVSANPGEPECRH